MSYNTLLKFINIKIYYYGKEIKSRREKRNFSNG